MSGTKPLQLRHRPTLTTWYAEPTRFSAGGRYVKLEVPPTAGTQHEIWCCWELS